jgi:uncharacterized protein
LIPIFFTSYPNVIFCGHKVQCMSEDTVIHTVLVKPVSADCNLACAYCFYSPKSSLYPESSPRMSEETLEKLIEEVLMAGAPVVNFIWQGGEPTLAGLDFYEKAMEYQRLFKYPKQVIENSIQTNGLIVDEEWAGFFKKEDWLVGVSLDGSREEHDAYRVHGDGSSSYHKVRKALDSLRALGVQYNILALLNDVNVKNPKRLYKWLVNEGHKHLQFIPCMEMNPTGGIAGFSITPKEYGKFLIEVFDEWVKDIPGIYVRDFEDILIKIITGTAPNCVYNGKCGGYIVVEYNGDVYPCDFFVEPEWLLGNIMETSLEEISSNLKFKEFKERRKLQEPCHGCKWVDYCHGGCQKTMLNGRYYFCESLKEFLKHAEEKLHSIADSINTK